MANGFVGDVAVEIDGVLLNLRFDFNALCEFEGVVGETAPLRLERLERGDGSFRDLRAMIWAMLQRHQAGVTLSAVGEMIGGGDGAALTQGMLAAFRAAAPEAVIGGVADTGKTRAAAVPTH